MKPLSHDNFDQLIADEDTQKQLRKERQLHYTERSISRKEFPETLDEGWYILDDTLKNRVKLAKNKSHNEIFEDEVWCLLSKMGFKYLSNDRNCRIQYDAKDGSAQQIDVLAVDDECALLIECKSADSDVPVKAQFKTNIESIGGNKAGLIRSVRKIFNKPDLKVALVLATKNYRLSDKDFERLDTFDIRHFSKADMDYYDNLVTHLGSSARFQFQADLFPNRDIPEMENEVYAIQGKMGGYVYYSFSIEPAKLLKIGYILHRSKSIKLLPSYQRLIKKSRLTKIRNFVNIGGFFPNSIIISLAGNKNIKFEQSSPSLKNSATKHGVLYLPKKYRSAYIIDGQHRLYAYGGSDYAETNTIPVVAFVDIDRQLQLELFMQINENQKSVSKNLKHTLDADLKWESDNLRDRAEGVKKQLAQDLGVDLTSPLYERVLVGEDQRTETKVITLEAILKGLNQTNFVGKFTKTEVKEAGLFDTGSSERTLTLLMRLFKAYFEYFAENLEAEWNRTQRNNGILSINDGITALITIFGDIVRHMNERGEIRPLKDSPQSIVDNASHYLVGIKKFFQELSEADRAELRTKYGSGAPTRLRRIFQRAINESRDDFCPDGLDEYWRDQSKIYNADTYRRMADIEMLLKDEVKEHLMKMHGNMWLKKGLPKELYTLLITEAAKKNREIENPDDEREPWDCLYIINYRDIMEYQAQWSNLFQKRFTIPGQESLKKQEKTKWLVKLNDIRNNSVMHNYSVTKAEADYTAAIHDWLILGDDEKIRDLTEAQTGAESGSDAPSD